MTFNHGVEGSSPSALTNKTKHFLHFMKSTRFRCSERDARQAISRPHFRFLPCESGNGGAVTGRSGPPNAQRHQAEYDRLVALRMEARPSNPQQGCVGAKRAKVQRKL